MVDYHVENAPVLPHVVGVDTFCFALKGHLMFRHFAMALALATAMAGPVLAAAPGEPSIPQIYQAAEAGRLKDADEMIAKVLQDHPASAKAHFVHAELLLKEGKIAAARSALARAEELAPGLPFVKPETVSSLRRSFEAATVSGGPRAGSNSGSTTGSGSTSVARPMASEVREPARAAGGFGMLPIALIGIAGIGLVVFLIRRARPANAPMPMGQAATGVGGGYGAPSYPGGYGGGVPQPAPGMQGMQMAPGAPAAGGVMGGLGGALMTGAAVGLGAAAVGAAVRHFSQSDSHPERDAAPAASQQPAFANDLGPTPDRDLGGNDFGITDTASWDSSGGDSGGSTDWDS